MAHTSHGKIARELEQFSRDIQDTTTETTFLHCYFHGPRAMVGGYDGFTTHVQRLKATPDTFGRVDSISQHYDVTPGR
ncbi:hypothetical protein HOLleu_09373 [Holothuria leucospilota]|uniref:Uncharacterized protein n=1 Tax=Holothuria leucospilota TaxID=206669 RepID=A0A9Q1CC65_HOLLE|nr:hypothetical protein HOLleu_09373 [Holothuria leucospilota]